MHFRDVQVSGITKVVFNRKTIWNQMSPGNNWFRPLEPNVMKQTVRCHAEMMGIINLLKADRRYRMWVHGDTLNIVRKSAEPSEHADREPAEGTLNLMENRTLAFPTVTVSHTSRK
jgi:hypothetical protein